MNDRLPTHMPTSNRPLNAGSSMNDDTARLDAVAKVTGKAKYGKDIYLPNMLFAAFVRCPYGSGALTGYDEAAARSTEGVVDVVISREEGRYAGQPLGHVVAESRSALRRGLAALDPQFAIGEVKTRIIDGAGDMPEPEARTSKILAEADVTLEAEYSTQVQTHSPLETHGATIDFDGDRVIAYVSTQGTFAARDGLDRAFGIDRSKIEVRCEYIGGGFGSKLNGAGKEGTTAAEIAKKFKRPVQLFVDRRECHLDTGNRPSSRVIVRVGANRDGSILGGQIHSWGGVGVSRGGGGTRVPSGRYDFGALQRDHSDVQFNAGSPRAFRAPGCPQGAFVEELMLDELAGLLGKDPLAMRRDLDGSKARQEMYEQGAELIGWSKRRANGSQTGALRRGFGVGSTSWGAFPTRAESDVVVHRDGSVIVRSGAQDIGTGFRTVVAVVASDSLGIPLDRVTPEVGRSTLPVGPGSGGSMTTYNTAPAVAGAAADARRQVLELVAAEIDDVAAGELTIVDGAVMQGERKLMSWNDACGRIPGDSIVGHGSWSRQKAGGDSTKGHSEGVQFVDLTVDTETGVIRVDKIVAIQACGRVVCRKTAESQVIGAVIQGVSYALFEDKILDRNVGAMVNPNLEWYRVAGTNDTPHIVPVMYTKEQDGVRPLGEPPTIPTSGAIAGAVLNALGAPVRHLPLTPDRVLAAFEGASS